MKKIFPFFLVLVVLEIAAMIYIGSAIGFFSTLLLIVATSIAGAYFSKKQGLLVLQKARYQMEHGYVPGEEIMDGLCVLLAGILLIIPGFITDMTGLIFLLPFTRNLLKPIISRYLGTIFRNKGFVMMRRF